MAFREVEEDMGWPDSTLGVRIHSGLLARLPFLCVQNAHASWEEVRVPGKEDFSKATYSEIASYSAAWV